MNVSTAIVLYGGGTGSGCRGQRCGRKGRKPRTSEDMDKRITYQHITDRNSDVQDRWRKLTEWRVGAVKNRMSQLTRQGMSKIEAFKKATKEVTEGKLDLYRVTKRTK